MREQARNKVNLYRAYRIGELPDIEVKYSELILPLQALAQRDTDIARQLFSTLFLAIYESLKKDPKKNVEKLDQHVQTMLETSTKFFPPFIGSLLRIAFGSSTSHIVLPAKVLGKVGSESGNYHMSIMLLEKQITERVPVAPPPAKRSKTSSLSQSTVSTATGEDWSELASLYRAIDETDFFRNIYERKISTSEKTSLGIHAELMGDYRLAYDIYNQATNNASFNHAAPNDVAIWEQQAMESVEKLVWWDQLAIATMELVGDTASLWLNRTHLGYFIRSHLKLLEGIRKYSNEERKTKLNPWTADNPNPLYPFLEEALQDKTKFAPLLFSQPSFLLCLISIFLLLSS